MKKLLENLIRDFKKKKVVEIIFESNGNYAVYQNQKTIMSTKLNNFRKKVDKILEKKCYVMNYEVFPQDALQVAFICMMSDIRDNDLFGDPEVLPTALRKVEGKCAFLANNIANFLSVSDGLGNSFDYYLEEELLKKFF